MRQADTWMRTGWKARRPATNTSRNAPAKSDGQCPLAVELAADVGADQANRAERAGAGDREPVAERDALVDLQAVGGQGRTPSRSARLASVQLGPPPIWAPPRRTAPALPTPVAVNPRRRNMAAAT